MNKSIQQSLELFEKKFVFKLINQLDEEKIYGTEDQRINIKLFLKQELEKVALETRREAIEEIKKKFERIKKKNPSTTPTSVDTPLGTFEGVSVNGKLGNIYLQIDKFLAKPERKQSEEDI